MSVLVRILVIDDSAFVRKVVQELLGGSPFCEVVGTARDGEDGLEMAARLMPDVITCDVTMPRMDGVEFVRRQMAVRPVPILMLTSSPEDCAPVMAALEAGAVDFVQKPTATASDELRRVRDELVDKVKEAGRSPVLATETVALPVSAPAAIQERTGVDLIVIGISTGGPQALRYMIPQFPKNFPVPIAIVLHMPEGYTALFAEKLNEVSQVNVIEAAQDRTIEPGMAVIARAGRHLRVKRGTDGKPIMDLTMHPTHKPHRPSVDVLFRSAAEHFGSRVLAVVMTGMGSDGKEGAAWVKSKGGVVLTESGESCIVFGMPRAVAESGLSDGAYPLASMAEGITKHL